MSDVRAALHPFTLDVETSHATVDFLNSHQAPCLEINYWDLHFCVSTIAFSSVQAMWSIVQRRQLRKHVEYELGQGKTNAKSSPPKDSSSPSRERGVSPSSLERQAEPVKSTGKTEPDDARFVIHSAGDDDPLDPRNWPLSSRCKNIAILCFLIFVQAWAGATESMANTAASQEFGVSSVAENLSTAMYLFGVGSGALFVGPLSETVGRNPTYLVSTFCYLFFVLGCALTPTFGGQVACRFFVGLSSSATLAINGSSVRDQFRAVKRAFVFPVLAWANVAGKHRHLFSSLDN